jgi:hypothetical protein
MFTSDIDIDFANRDEVLCLISHINASIDQDNKLRKHPTGIYVTRIPYDPRKNCSNISYKIAEERGYIKLDFLNVSVYSLIRDQAHYDCLLNQPVPWEKLNDESFVKQLIHVSRWHSLLNNLPEKVDSVLKMAMFLSIIRPGKKHLIGKSWEKIEKEVWDGSETDGYAFKKSHAISYALLVTLHMKLLAESGGFSNK